MHHLSGCGPAVLLVRALDFFVGDPLHHSMETGMLTGTKPRVEQESSHVEDVTDRTPPTVGSVATTP